MLVDQLPERFSLCRPFCLLSKQFDSGRADGVAVLAEGLIEIVDSQDLRGLEQIERDEHGHLRLSEVDLGDVLRREVTKRLKALGLFVSIASQYVLNGGTAAMVSIQDG